ncbi:MAG: site-specific DNA-methyltransferase [Arcticibacter sp.]
MNKQELIQKLKKLEGLTAEEKADLINLVNKNKKYGLVWEDKPEAVEEELCQSLPVLKEVKDKAIISDVNVPNHILIEGDNLHALTALTFTHESKIDVIYIDPPYNTGNKDFRYNDSFVDREDSYRHSKWLSFMSKRLEIAKQLLSERGVIFISIDDYEQATLKLLCDQIFTEMNFVGNVIWQRAYAPINLKKTISQNHDFILVYCKQNISSLVFNKLPRKEKQVAMYKNYDNDPRGDWKSDNLSVGPAVEKNIYPITTPSGRVVYPPKGYSWRLSKERLQEFISDNRIWFGKDGSNVPSMKRFISEVKEGVVAMSLWTYEEVGHTQEAKKELKEILHEEDAPFETVKPIKLIDRILRLSTDSKKPYVILDFFAGSGTTLHATMQLNAQDEGTRQCILITNNESNICEEVTYERNRRVIQGYTNAKGIDVEGLRKNNLRYYKTDFVPSPKFEVNKRMLTQVSAELLQIKENCYHDVTRANGFNPQQCGIFTDNGCRVMIVVYHSRNQLEVCEQLVAYIKQLEPTDSVKLYGFSPEKETLMEDFAEVADRIDPVPLPEPIYNAFKNAFRTLKLDRKSINHSDKIEIEPELLTPED